MRTTRTKNIKRALRKFWKELGMTKEEFEMFLGALSIIMFPIVLEIILALFGK